MGLDIKSLIGGTIGDAIKTVVGSFKEDPALKAQLQSKVDDNAAIFKLQELQLEAALQTAVNQEVLAQIAVNEADAKGNWYQSSWRPTIGYICGSGLAYSVLGQPILTYFAGIFKFPPAPTIDTSTLMTLLIGMLGIGTLRTIEKLKDKD